MKLFDGQFVLSLNGMNLAIRQEFERYGKREGFVVVIFCPEGNRYSKPIFDNINFWNCYSDQYITILLPGYDGGVDGPDVGDRVNMKDKTFIYRGFEEIFKAFETSTRWRYSGGCDVLCFRMKLGEKIALDKSRAIAFNVEEIDPDGKFDLPRYIGGLITKARNSFERDPLEKSDEESLLALFKAILLTALPEKLVTFARRKLQIDLTRPSDQSPTEGR
jgi:hypothetical protein